MATTPTRHRFNRAMALAIAAGVTFTGGVQIAHETNVAQAETLRADDPQFEKGNMVYVNIDGPGALPMIITDGHISVLRDRNTSEKSDPYITPIPREVLQAAGLQDTAPITISTGRSTHGRAEVVTPGGTARSTVGEVFSLNGIAELRYYKTTDEMVAAVDPVMTLSQNEKEVKVHEMQSYIGFAKPKTTSPEVGETLTLPAPEIGFAHSWSAHRNFLRAKYHLVNPVPGASIDANGVLTYTPPAEAAGKTVEIEVAGEIVGSNDPNVFGVQSDGNTAGASVIYSFDISKIKTSITDNNNGTFTINNGTSNLKAITIDTKKGIRNVVKQGSTLTFTLANGNTSAIDVTDNVTVKQNSDGTVTISDGTTTLTVSTAITSIIDNGDDTFTLNNGTGSTKTITINRKDRVQNVVKQDNTLTFTMADGSTKTIDVTANITLKQNNNGTFTISDGTITFTVSIATVSITDNGDGTFTFNDGTAGAKDIIVNTKDGVQDVTKQGNTLIFTMADGGTKTIDVAANITLKQNTNGTATISDGTTTLTVATVNTYIEKVEKNAKGDYVLTRNDGEALTINLQDIRNDINTLKIKDAPSRAEHNAVKNDVDKLRDQLNEFTGQSDKSLEEIANRINTLDGKIDTNVAAFKREISGINTALQDLESRVERTENHLIKEVRNNGNGTFTLVTEKHGDIPGVIDTSAGVTDIISNSDGTITLKFAGKKPRTINLNQVEVTETGKGTPKHTITIKVPGEKPFRFNAFDTYVTNINADGKGKYTLTLNNGETVAGTIDTSKTITTIENRPDGSIVFVRTDGMKSDPIKLEQVKVIEAGKGTPQHTVTIAVPGGETVTLDAYDNFVTSVTKTSDGIYTIARNDGQTWTINVADLYKRVAGLEAKDAPTRDEFNAVNNDIAEYKKLVDARFTAVEGDVDALRADLATLEKRATVLETRVDRVDGVLGDLAKCNSAKQISGISTALSIALYALSQVQLPGVADINTQIQQQIGIYNANAAAMWGRYGGVLQAAAATTMAAGLLGSLAYALNACQPYNRTDEMKHTPAGEMTANIDARKVAREARNVS